MTIEQMQTALDLYPFPRLSEAVRREFIIIAAYTHGEDIDTIDAWLIELGYAGLFDANNL
ncbi:MAG: hypothetical protein ACYCWE_06600 [Eubacteriales bacterium]